MAHRGFTLNERRLKVVKMSGTQQPCSDSVEWRVSLYSHVFSWRSFPVCYWIIFVWVYCLKWSISHTNIYFTNIQKLLMLPWVMRAVLQSHFSGILWLIKIDHVASTLCRLCYPLTSNNTYCVIIHDPKDFMTIVRLRVIITLSEGDVQINCHT